MPTSTVPKSVNMLPYDKCKRDFADVIKFRILSWGDYLELPDGFHVITRILRKGRERERERERESRRVRDDRMEAEVGTLNQEMRATSRGWQWQGTDCPMQPAEMQFC